LAEANGVVHAWHMQIGPTPYFYLEHKKGKQTKFTQHQSLKIINARDQISLNSKWELQFNKASKHHLAAIQIPPVSKNNLDFDT
jgi:hypothetical protein